MKKQDLQKLLTEHNITQRELAIKIGTAEATVSDWLNGKRVISKAYAKIIKNFFDNRVNPSAQK